MGTDRKSTTGLRGAVAALLVCAAAMGMGATSAISAIDPGAASLPAEAVPAAPAISLAPSAMQVEARTAATNLIQSLASGDAATVWMFATEEEQEAFATEDEAYRAFVDAYPPLAFATKLAIESVTTDGDARVVTAYVTDQHGLEWRAQLGLWKSDAGDWKLVTCDIAPAPESVG
jgi:hypothetical protein